MAILRRITAKTVAGVTEAAAIPLRCFFPRQFISTATASAAAQPEFDYDYYCYDYRAKHESNLDRLAVAPMEDSESSIPSRELQLVFIGSPRTKKHLYAEKLSKLLAVPHISMASLVRQELSPRSFLYRQIANAVNCGTIVPEDIILGLLSKRLNDGYDKGESGFILDGIPRSLYQAKIVDQLAMINLVVNFRCFDFCSIKNHMDAEGDWKEKLQFYSAKRGKFSGEGIHSMVPFENQLAREVVDTKPLEDYYRKQKKLINIEVCNTPRETWRELLVELQLQHMIAASPSGNIT